MKLFQTVQKCSETIGICPYHKNHKDSKFNWKNAVYLVAMVPTGPLLFLLFETERAVEIGLVFYISVSGLASVAAYLEFIRKKENIFKIFASFEMFIEKSKFDWNLPSN